MQETTFIYTLSDPKTELVRYVGKTNTPYKRKWAHFNDNINKTKKSTWIRGLILNGFLPDFNVIDEVPMCDWEFWEKHYIKLYKSFGSNLVNSNEGGINPITSSETKKTQREIKLGKKLSLKHIESLKKYYSEKRKLIPKKIKKEKGESNRMVVSQYDLNGCFIRTFISIAEASKSTKIAKHVISKVCRGICSYNRGGFYMWKYGDLIKNGNNINPFSKQRKTKNIKSVIQFSLNGDLINEYERIFDAANTVGVTSTAIRFACIKGFKTKGYIWKFKSEINKHE